MSLEHSYIRSFALAAICWAAALPAFAAAGADTILAENSKEVVRLSEFEIELLRVPAEMRDEFVSNRKRVGDLLAQMLLRKTLASEARAAKLDQKPENAGRMKAETERLLAQFRTAALDEQSGAQFDQKLAQYQARAREVYLVERDKFRTPAEVSASHILFDAKKRSSEEAKKLAEQARARIAAGADFKVVAVEVSEDPSVATNGGALGWFTAEKMDPAFSKAAFELKAVGTLSEPVQSQFGWHIIRLDGRKESTIPPFEEMRDRIVADMRTKYIEQQRETTINAIRSDPTNAINEPALEEIVAKARAGRPTTPKPATP